MNPLTGIHSVAVNDCVVKSFPKCYSDSQFLAVNPLRSFDQSHQPIQQRRDGFNLTRYASVDVEERSTCSCLSNLQSQIRSFVRSLGSDHGKCLTRSHVPATSHDARNQKLQIPCGRTPKPHQRSSGTAARGTACSTYGWN